MHLMYYLDGEGKRVYTLKNVDPSGKPTLSAHPARFSPDDKYSKYRILLKKRFGILLTQQPTQVWWTGWMIMVNRIWLVGIHIRIH